VPRQVTPPKRPSAVPRKAPPSGVVVVRKLAAAIKRVFGDLRLKVEVSSEVVPGTKLRRVYVVAPSFRRMEFMERQNFIWRIANNALTPRELMMITMILTLTPQDVTAG
jgi:hypothetical protein